MLITPFSAMLMAATAEHGSMPMPVLIRGTTTTVDKPAPARTPQVAQAVQTYMRAVVQRGDGGPTSGIRRRLCQDRHRGVHRRRRRDPRPCLDRGYRGDLAFAALIVGGEDSVHTNEVLDGS